MSLTVAERLAEALEDFDKHLRGTELVDPSKHTSKIKNTPTITADEADDDTPNAPMEPVGETTFHRPNGERYIPRKLTVDGRIVRDVDFIRAAYNKRLPIMLIGPPGTGKTAMLEASLPGLVTIQGTVETEVADFLGSWVQRPDGTYAWVDGPLPYAAENGLPLLVDEIALVDPRTLAVCYGAMDGRNEIVITANPERGVVKPKDGFMVVGACNPDVPGAVMSDALTSRFKLKVEVGTDWGLATTLGVPPGLIQVARNLNLKHRSGQVSAAPQLRELLTFKDVAETFGQTIALQNFVGGCHPEDQDTVLEQIEAVFGAKPGILTI